MNKLDSTEVTIDDPSHLRARQISPRLVSLSTAVTLMWGYLVMGEVVVTTEFPELLAALLVLTLGALAMHQAQLRFAHLLPRLTLRERTGHLVMAFAFLLPLFLLGLFAGAIVGEVQVTLLLLFGCGAAKTYQMRLERRILAEQSKWGGLTLLGAMLATGVVVVLLLSR